jgi:hypothetical protein
MVGKSSTSSITRALTLENTAGAAITIARVSPQCALIGAVDLDSGANLSVSSGSLSLASGSSARLLIASYGRASASAADLNIALASPTSMSGSSTVLTITANDRLPSAMRAAACWSIRQLNSALFMQEGPHSEIVLGVSPSASGLLQANDVLLSLDLNAEIGSAHASSMLPIAGVARAVAPSAIPVSLGFNGGGGLLPGQEPSVWSASGAFSEPPADEGETLPAQRTITFYYAGGDTISLADIRARMVLSIPFISPPDPFLASDAPSSAPIAMLSTSSAPETIVKTSSSAPSRLVAPLFSAERLAESPIINALVTCSVAPSVTVEQGAGTAVTSAHRSVGSFLSNVSIQAVSAPCRASFGIPPAHTQESAAVSLRRVGQ